MYEEQGRSKPLLAASPVEPFEEQPSGSHPAGTRPGIPGPDQPRLAAPAETRLEQAFRLYHGLVYRAAYRVTGSTGDAEDVLQSVFLRLLQRGAQSEPVANLESYLYRAAVNNAVDLMRSRQAARSVPLDEVAAGLAENSSLAPDRVHQAGEIRAWLRRALTRLSPMAAEIFMLRFFEGKENPEIARLLGTTPGTVAVTLHRSRERIEKELQEYLGGKS